MRLLVNPDDDARYLGCLNECFPGWGGEAMYRWCFKRAASAPPPVRLVFADDDGAWLAGSGITYRMLQVDGARRLIGVMTGSWTLPAARGKGLFPAFIQETRERVAGAGGVAVLAFLGDLARASTRKLIDAGSRTVPSSNAIGELEGAPEGSSGLETRAASRADAESLFERFAEERKDAAAFVYDDVAAFSGQLIERAWPVDLVRAEAQGAVALIERASDTDRVLFAAAGELPSFLQTLWAEAAKRGRKLYAFGLGPSSDEQFAAAGLVRKPGVVSLLPADANPQHAELCDSLASARWVCHHGDRI